MPTLASSGTQSCTISTEHQLWDDSATNVPGSFVFELDFNAAVHGDEFEIRVYTKVLSGGTLRVLKVWEVGPGAPISEPNVQTPPLLAHFHGRLTLTQTAGTGRSIPWQVVKL
jgi:hypothetical protein